MRDFLLDLELCHEILSGDLSDSQLQHDVGELIDDEDPLIDDAYEDLRHLTNNRHKVVQRFGERGTRTWERALRMTIQSHILATTRLSLRDVYSFLHGSGDIPDSFHSESKEVEHLKASSRRMSAAFAEMAAGLPFRIKLAHLPTRHGESREFQRRLRSSIRQFKNKYSVFSPLYFPIRLSVIYRPPNNATSIPQDLDNLMIPIVKVVTSELAPPISYLTHDGFDDSDRSSLPNQITKYLAGIPKSIYRSLSGFDIVKVSNTTGEQGGYVSLALTGGFRSGGTLWQRIDALLDKWEPEDS
jgi:hypothetical protein